jgi:hypothetical protein
VARQEEASSLLFIICYYSSFNSNNNLSRRNKHIKGHTMTYTTNEKQWVILCKYITTTQQRHNKKYTNVREATSIHAER